MKPSDVTGVLLPLMREAGAAILALQQKTMRVMKKGEDDIVTQADLLANDILKSGLLRAFPEDGWLSEESVDDPVRLLRSHVWIVDPIDGTREYAAHVPEYAISVARVENGEPVVSAIFNPAADELYVAVKGEGAWMGERRLHCRKTASPDKLILLASRSEYKRGEWMRFETSHHVEVVGSIAYKLALIAAGKADATLSLGPKNEWDIAAGVLLVTEAGGIVTNQRRERFLFNRPSVLVDGIVATAAEVNEAVFKMISSGCSPIP